MEQMFTGKFVDQTSSARPSEAVNEYQPQPLEAALEHSMWSDRDMLESKFSMNPTTNSNRFNSNRQTPAEKASHYTAENRLKHNNSMPEINRTNNTTEIKKCKGAIETDKKDETASGSDSAVSFC